MKYLVFLIVVATGIFSSDLSAQVSQYRGVKNKIEQAKRAASEKIPKEPQVPRKPIRNGQNYKGRASAMRASKALEALKAKTPDFGFMSENKYRSAFDSLSKNPAATGEDYLQLYYIMCSDSKYRPIGNDLKFSTVVDKYLDVEKPTPERLAEVFDIARQQYPEQLHRSLSQTPSSYLLERATTRFYMQVLEGDSTFTSQDAAKLSQLYDELRHGKNNEGIALYYYLSGFYEFAFLPLEEYYKTFEIEPGSDKYIKNNINEIASKLFLLEGCYEAIGFSEQRDSLRASAIYQRIIRLQTPK